MILRVCQRVNCHTNRLCVQDMERGGALENLSTVETVKILVDAYLGSDAAYNATAKIQSLSKNVSSPHTSAIFS